MNDNRKSNVSQSWSDSGWSQDGNAVLKKDEREPETAQTGTSDHRADDKESDAITEQKTWK